MDLMSKEAKEEFSEAVSDVGELVSGGNYTPKEAIKKVASERGFGRPMTENLARTYDIGVTWRQFGEETLEEKVATVQLAKANEVTDEMFGDIEKEANDMTHYTDNVPDYIRQNQRPETHPISKAAATIPDEPEEFDFQNAMRDLRKAASHLDDIHSEVRRFGRRWNRHLKRAREVVSGDDRSFQEIHKRATALLGEQCQGYMRLLADDMGEELADMDKEAGRYYAVDETEEPFETLSEGASMSKEAQRLLRCQADLTDAMEKLASRMINGGTDEQAGALRRWVRRQPGITIEKEAAIDSLDDLKGSTKSDLTDVEKKQVELLQEEEKRRRQEKEKKKERRRERSKAIAEGTGGAAQGLTDTARELTQSSLLGMLDYAKGDEDDLLDPSSAFPAEHMSELRHIKAKAMLNSFLSSDPILSRRDPDAVIESFNRVRNLRPDLVDHPSMVRAMTRQLTETSNRQDPEALRKMIDKGKPKPEKGRA